MSQASVIQCSILTNILLWFLAITQYILISLCPSDTIGQHRSRSTLAELMACCLVAPNHYLSQCWLTSGRSCGINAKAISWEMLKISILDMNSKIDNTIAVYPRGQWFDTVMYEGHEHISIVRKCITVWHSMHNQLIMKYKKAVNMFNYIYIKIVEISQDVLYCFMVVASDIS